MVITFNTFQELMSRCTTNELKSQVSSVLRNDRYISWNLVSCSVEGDRCWSEFESLLPNSDQKRHLSCKVTPEGEYRHYSVI